ncbi:MAG: polyprenol monophosphomannose synthase [Candidatus Hodarchaeota archaeon]
MPTYNEKENISRIIETINKLNFNKEILVVDDDSIDGTLEIINELRNQYKNLTLIRRTGKKGRGLAGIVGLKYFIQSDNDIFVELDADFSHHPKYIPELLKYLQNYDVVIGSRMVVDGIEKGRKKVRSSLSLMANLIIRIILGTKIKDCTSGYRAFKREVLQKLDFDKFVSINPEIVEELLYGCILQPNAKIMEIPIIYYERAGGKSKLNLKKLIKVLIAIIKIRLRGKIIVKS